VIFFCSAVQLTTAVNILSLRGEMSISELGLPLKFAGLAVITREGKGTEKSGKIESGEVTR
jgi:hypothetical protein